jgi:hypothetical protein
MVAKQSIVASVAAIFILTTAPLREGVAQTAVSPGDSAAMMDVMLANAQTHLSAKRRFIDPANDGHPLSAAKAAQVAAKVNAVVARQDTYSRCDERRRCRIAPDAEVVSIEPPTLLAKDRARARIVAHQGTSIERMPVATSTFNYTLERRAGVWSVTGVRVTRQ